MSASVLNKKNSAPASRDNRSSSKDPNPFNEDHRLRENQTAPSQPEDRVNVSQQKRSHHSYQLKIKNPTQRPTKITGDTLILSDSNVNNLDPTKLKHDMISQNITCYTVANALQIMKNAQFDIIPSHILIHLGINCVEKNSASHVSDDMSALIELLLENCPRAKIVISSVTPRSDRMDIVGELNRRFEDICWYNRIDFLNNNNISERKLEKNDAKHLNRSGFFTLLANFRWALYGIMPKCSNVNSLK